MKHVFLWVVVVVCTSNTSFANEKITLGLTDIDYAPYWSSVNDQHTGLVVDIAHKIFEGSQYELEIVTVPRKRINQWLYQGRIDLRVGNLDWLQEHENLSASGPVFTLSDHHWSGVDPVMPSPTRVCAVLGFLYSDEFNQRVQSGEYIRIDVAKPEQAFSMLAYQRCDMTVADLRLGTFMIEKLGLERKVTPLNKVDASWQLSFISLSDRKDLIEFINQQIKAH